MATKSETDLTHLDARLEQLETRISSLRTPSTREIERAAEKAIAGALEPLIDRLSETDEELAAINRRLKTAEKYRAPKLPNVAKTVAAALEPVADEILNIERNLKDDIQSAAARSSANALEARNAATGTVLASETALKSIAAHFAYGEK